MTSFNRVLLLALLYLAVLTAAVPVVEGEVVDHDALEARAVSRGRTARPVQRPVRRPAPTTPRPGRAPPKKGTPVPPRKGTPVRIPPKQTAPVHVPSKNTTRPGTHTTAPAPHQTALPHGGNTTLPHGNTTLPHGGAPHGGNATACPLPNKKPVKTKGPRAVLEYVSSFFKRASPEFIGWHGTNSNTATYWHSAGYIKQPWSFIDIISQRRTGSSGANQELGAGLYVTDSLTTAQGFADINAGQPHNAGSTPFLCAIFARDSTSWRSATPKAWMPDNVIGDNANPLIKQQLENYRLQWLQRVYPTVHPVEVVRIAPLDRGRGHPPGQLVIPASRVREFYAQCLPSGGGRIPPGAPSGDINYNLARQAWHVRDTNCV